MDALTRLVKQNPWWQDPNRINDDEKIMEWNDAIRYEPELLRTIQYDFSPNNSVVYTLRGLRQVGKTTLIKLQIKRFLDRGVSPISIMYYTMDLAQGPNDIVDIIERYMSYTKRRRGKSRCYIFLDEISAVSNWQKGIKWLVDAGYLKNTTVLATGSHSLDLKNAAERLPGRRGVVDGSHDKMLLPMSFTEYTSALDPELGRFIRKCVPTRDARNSILCDLTKNKIDESLQRLILRHEELNSLLREYMVTGGLPKVVNEYAQHSTLTEPDYATYLGTLTGEWGRMRRNTSILSRFCRRLVLSMGNRISWSQLSKMSDMSGPGIASDYADLLERLFVLAVVYRFDECNGHLTATADKKMYVTDPYLFHVLRAWTDTSTIHESSTYFLNDTENRGRMLECVAANHLIRLAFDLTAKKSTFDHHNHVFYWVDKKQREVDFVLDGGSVTRMAIEVKLGNTVKNTIAMKTLMDRANLGGIVLSDSHLEERDDYLVIPASVFLTLV